MNHIECIGTSYLAPNRSVDELVVNNGVDSKRVFVYNCKGVDYYIFVSLQDLLQYFINWDDNRIWKTCATDDHVDEYLENEFKVN